MENWHPVPSFEGYYEINEQGQIRSLDRQVKVKQGYRFYKQRYLQSRINNRGYLDVRLSKDGVTKTKFLHILLAQTFIQNPDHKKFVNHKNGIKTDNRIENLEWCTHSENISHAYAIGLCNASHNETPVIDICTNKSFRSIRKAAEQSSIPYSTCKSYLNGNRNNITSLRIVKTDAA